MFFSLNELFLISTDCSLVQMTSYGLNPNFVLNLCAAVLLQSIIALVTNSLRIKILLGYFFVHLLVPIYVFYDLKDILMWLPTSFDDLILLLCVLNLISIFCHYLLLFLHQFFICFSAYVNHFI